MPFLLAAYVSTGLLICDPAALQTPSEIFPPLPLKIFVCQLAEASGIWQPLRNEAAPKSVFVTRPS